MVLGFDFFGFGSRRRTALQGFDRALTDLEVNPAYVDDGMRFLVYKWAEQELALLPEDDPGLMDRRLREAAELISFCVLGPAETDSMWGPEVRRQRQQRFDAALGDPGADTMDANLIKLALAKGIAAPDIAAQATLEGDA
jgi:hypothetical protein